MMQDVCPELHSMRLSFVFQEKAWLQFSKDLKCNDQGRFNGSWWFISQEYPGKITNNSNKQTALRKSLPLQFSTVCLQVIHALTTGHFHMGLSCCILFSVLKYIAHWLLKLLLVQYIKYMKKGGKVHLFKTVNHKTDAPTLTLHHRNTRK